MRELHQRLYRRYRLWIQRMIEQAGSQRAIDIDAKRAALTYVQMVDGFWMGWIMDREAYAMDEVTKIVSDWLLGLFGNEDRAPTPEQVDEHEAELKKHGKNYEFHRYDGAGHGFFYYDRPAYRIEQALDGWQKVFGFLQKHLSA